MMSQPSLEELASRLGDELRAAASHAPDARILRGRSKIRTVARTATGLLGVTVAVVAMFQALPTDRGLRIEPVAPSGDSSPTGIADSTSETSGEPSGAPSSQSPANGRTVAPIDAPTPVPAVVLAVDPNGPSITRIDLEHGRSVTYPEGAHDMSADAISGATLLRDGGVAVWQNSTIRVYTSGLENAPFEHTPDEALNLPGAAASVRAFPTPDPSAIWIVQVGAGCCPKPVAGRAELIDLSSGEVTVGAELPPSTFPIAATQSGLLLNTFRYTDTGDGWVAESGSHRALLLDRSGSVTTLSEGEVLAANGDTVAILTCDDHDQRRGCQLDLLELPTAARRQRVAAPGAGTWTSISTPQGPTDAPPWNASAPDGRLLVGFSSGTQTLLVAIEPGSGGADVLLRVDGPSPSASWDRTGQHVVAVVGSDIHVYSVSQQSSFVIRGAIPDGYQVLGMG